MKGRIKRDVPARLPYLGNIRVGEKDEKTNLPRSLDHFIADGEYVNYFIKEYGEQPTRIGILFISDDPALACNERWELRKGRNLYAEGDGDIFTVWDENGQTIKLNTKEHKAQLEALAKSVDAKWRHLLTLTFIIPKVRGVFGAWKFSTTGAKSSIPQIVSVYDAVKEMAGTVINIPFDLIVEKVVSQKPGQKAVFPVVKLIANMSRDNMEKVKQYIDEGFKFHKLITDDIIDNMQKEIAYDNPDDKAK